MNEEQLQSPEQTAIRTVLRVGGLAAVALGLVLTIIGFVSFFSTFASFASPGGPGSDIGPPPYFWCAFVGMPLLAGGAAMLQFGFLGAFARYVAGESAPVAKDMVNYMGENTQPSVKAVAKSFTEGVLEAQREQQ